MSTLHVLFKVGEGKYVLPARDVLYMESFTGATKVPGTLPFVAGVVQIRSRVVPLVDLRTRFGLPQVATTLDSRVVVVQHGERAVGLLVDSAREVVGIAADAFAPPPEIVSEQAAGFVVAVAQAGAGLVMLLDFGKVIGEEVLHGDD
jgi:purine-binding chemotaxis protein CheW